MIQFFRNLRLHAISFWAGFIAATLLWLLIRILRPALQKGWQNLKTGIQSARQGLLTNTEQRHRLDTLKHIQGLHLAAPLFSLDEVLIPPRLMAPPPLVDPDEPPPYEDIVSTNIPFAPDWPEMAAVYQAKSLDIFEVLSGGSNIAIIGNPGIGKTTTLAYIAAKLARQEPEAGMFQNFVPVFIHASDIQLSADQEGDPLAVIIAAVSTRASTLTLPRLAEMLIKAFESQQVFLLLDGLDELAPESMGEIVTFLENLLAAFPGIRVAAAASAHQIDGLPSLGLAPVPLAVWGWKTQTQFIQQWRKLWVQFIQTNPENSDETYVDPLLLNGWLLNLTPATSPLEFTLKVWAVYAGDVRGPDEIDAIEAYIRRLIVNLPKARRTLEVLASHILTNMDSGVTESQAKDWLSAETAETPEFEPALLETAEGQTNEPQKISIPQVLPDLIQNGLLVHRSNRKYAFIHPKITAYMGGLSLAQQGRMDIFSQPAWPLKEMATSYMASIMDLGLRIRTMLAHSGDPLLTDRLTLGRWLQHIPRSVPERKLILQKLSNDLRDEKLVLGSRIRILSALAISGGPGIAALFRHLLNAPHDNVRQLAVLGCGYLRDSQSVGDLVKRLRDHPKVGQAACMALVNINTKPALEAVATVLLQGNEQLRRAAAESFAIHPAEGYPILQDGSQVDDLLVRRAVIYGLARVRQPWATQILEGLQIEDAQWVVKDAAAQAVDQIKNPDPSIPKPQPALKDLPWLIAFASDRESGLSEGDLDRTMLLKVLSEGNDDEILAALGQIRLRGETGVFPSLYHLIYGDHPELNEAAHYTLWHIGSMGFEIPPPAQFGLG